jgi:hypothetical protein
MSLVEEPPVPIVVHLRRQPYCDFFEMQISDGSSEEMDPEEARQWFAQHGASMIAVEKAMDYCWNFYKATITIKNPRVPVRSKLEPIV